MVTDCRAGNNNGDDDDDDDDDYVGPDLWEAVRSHSDVFQQPLYFENLSYMWTRKECKFPYQILYF